MLLNILPESTKSDQPPEYRFIKLTNAMQLGMVETVADFLQFKLIYLNHIFDNQDIYVGSVQPPGF
jgi:hypothetical protein